MTHRHFPILNAARGAALPAHLQVPGIDDAEPRPWYSMQNKSQATGEIFIYDEIGGFWDGTTAKDFARDLKALGKITTLNVFINSPGGSVFDGVAIFNVLQRHKAHKVVSIDGMALSIASVVAMAGNEIRMADNGMMMIHDPWTITIGNAAEMREMADNLDKVAANIRRTYVDRTGAQDSAVQDMMAAETWMDAREALDLGFIDAIGEDVQIAAKARGFAPSLSRYEHTPPALADAAAQPPVDYRDRVVQLRERTKNRL